MKTPTTLIIMDGFGLSPSQAAVKMAHDLGDRKSVV